MERTRAVGGIVLGFVLGVAVVASAWAQAPSPADPDLTRQALTNDPQTPTGGNPRGDVTIVEFFDYNCPYCMKAQPALEQLLAADHGIRMVYKDWPIFGAGSIAAARVALAAKWQDKYEAVHDALLDTPLRKVAVGQVRTIAVKAGADGAASTQTSRITAPRSTPSWPGPRSRPTSSACPGHRFSSSARF